MGNCEPTRREVDSRVNATLLHGIHEQNFKSGAFALHIPQERQITTAEALDILMKSAATSFAETTVLLGARAMLVTIDSTCEPGDSREARLLRTCDELEEMFMMDVEMRRSVTSSAGAVNKEDKPTRVGSKSDTPRDVLKNFVVEIQQKSGNFFKALLGSDAQVAKEQSGAKSSK